MDKTILPPGFRFHPTDEELIVYYLKRKVMGKPLRVDVIADIELYKFAPWDLPGKSCLKSKDLEWFFFCPRDKKYANGSRINRATDTGYWKTTGKERYILHNSRTVGIKKTLVFHIGRAPQGDRTDWVMHEYILEDKHIASTGGTQDAYVLCKIFHKCGPGPKHREQNSGSFDEEAWDDDIGTERRVSIPFMSSKGAPDDPTLLEPVLKHSVDYEVGVALSPDPRDGGDDLLDQLLEILGDSPLRSENANDKTSGLVFSPENASEASGLDIRGIYNGLEGFCGLAETRSSGPYIPDPADGDPTSQHASLELCSENYMELNDMLFSLEESEHTELVAANNLLMLHRGVQYPIPESMNMGFSDSPVDNLMTAAAAINNSVPSIPDNCGDQFGPSPKINACGMDTNLLYDSDVHDS